MNESIKPCKWICEERREEYSPWNLIIELAFIIPTFIVTIYGLFWLQPFGFILSIFYAIWCFGCYFVVFRIILCPNCYYYGRWCPDGMGKYAKKVFGAKGDVNNYKKALTIPTIGWIVVLLFPFISFILYHYAGSYSLIPIFFGDNILNVSALWYDVLFSTILFIYFTVHKRVSCRGCAHIKSCNLSKVPLNIVFLVGIIFIFILMLFF